MRSKVAWRSASRANYIDFCKTHPEINISVHEWRNIIYGYSDWFRNYILETGNKAKLPAGLGEFSILKVKKKATKIVDGKLITNMPVNWVESKKHKKIIYNLNFDTEGFLFKWIWFRRTSMIRLPSVWFFRPLRTTSRLLAHYLRVDPKYQHMYKEWQH